MESAIYLAEALIDNDTEKSCPFCSKEDYGGEHHDSGCPFEIAYNIKNNQTK
jgi:hypothetical protein